MARILKKHMTTVKYYEVLKIKEGLQNKDQLTERTLQGAIFPLRGKERELELLGVIQKGTLKLYTNARIDTSTEIKVDYQGIKYKMSSIKGDFPDDPLNTYYLEVKE